MHTLQLSQQFINKTYLRKQSHQISSKIKRKPKKYVKQIEKKNDLLKITDPDIFQHLPLPVTLLHFPT